MANLLLLVLMVVVVKNRELEKRLGWSGLGVVRKTDVRRCQGEDRQQ